MFHHALRTMFINVSLEADECDKGSFKILFYEKICWLYKFFFIHNECKFCNLSTVQVCDVY